MMEGETHLTSSAATVNPFTKINVIKKIRQATSQSSLLIFFRDKASVVTLLLLIIFNR